jgi:CRP-like cAMP-binding protein
VTWQAGDTIVQAGGLADAAYFIVEGMARSGLGREHGPGDAIGTRELLAEVPHPGTIVATGPMRALAVGAATIFDVAEDNPDFGLAMIANFSEAILALSAIPTN